MHPKVPNIWGILRAALSAGREQARAQTNRPNPDFAPSKYRSLYFDTDPRRFDPGRTDAAAWEHTHTWRKTMYSVLPRNTKLR